MDNILEVNNLLIEINNKEILREVSFSLKRGEILAIVGESGSGKSSLAKCLMGLLPHKEGTALYKDKKLHEKNDLIGKELTMVPQNSMNSFNPTLKLGRQITEGLLLHRIKSKDGAMKEALKLMNELQLDEELYYKYPHELSGGMKQRMAFIMGILPEPQIVILDEVTTGLDSVNKKKVLEKICELKKSTGILFISHEIDLVREIADRVIVLKNGLHLLGIPIMEKM